MKVLCTYTVNHKINGEARQGKVLVGLHKMEKDGNTYEFIKTYKLENTCHDVPTGSDVTLLFTERGKVGGFNINK